MLHMFLTFLLVSDAIWYLFVLLMAFAANGHLAYYAVLFVSLLFLFLAGQNPLSAALLLHRNKTASKNAGIYS